MKVTNLKPRMERTDAITLVGVKLRMSLAANRTAELWRNFMPRRTEVMSQAGTELYSVEMYDDLSYFAAFSPLNMFDKWAAVAVDSADNIPAGMARLDIPGGDYAVFQYRGRPSDAGATYQFIYGQWLPDSEFVLDNRPHFAVMGERYKGEHPDSEEELWIPIRAK